MQSTARREISLICRQEDMAEDIIPQIPEDAPAVTFVRLCFVLIAVANVWVETLYVAVNFYSGKSVGFPEIFTDILFVIF